MSGYFWADRADKLVSFAADIVAAVQRQPLEASVCLATFGPIVPINISFSSGCCRCCSVSAFGGQCVYGYIWADRADKLGTLAAVALAAVRRQLLEASVCLAIFGPIVQINWSLLQRLLLLLLGGGFGG